MNRAVGEAWENSYFHHAEEESGCVETMLVFYGGVAGQYDAPREHNAELPIAG